MNKESERKARWLADHTERIVLQVQKGSKARIQSAAAAAGQSMTTYIMQSVESRIQSEAGDWPLSKYPDQA